MFIEVDAELVGMRGMAIGHALLFSHLCLETHIIPVFSFIS